MNAFESVVPLVLRSQGYWIHQSVKVELTKAEKRAINRSTSPRWEIDLVAYSPRGNELLAVECKSYMDSVGVQYRSGALHPAKSYKLFSEPRTRRVVLGRLARQLTASGHCRPRPRVTLCLAAGKIASSSTEAKLVPFFHRQGWRLIGPGRIVAELKNCIDTSYENDVAFVVAKLLGRAAS